MFAKLGRKGVIIAWIVALIIGLTMLGVIISRENDRDWQVRLEKEGDSSFPEYPKENKECLLVGVGNITGDYDPRTANATGDVAVSQMIFEPLISVGLNGSPRMVLASDMNIQEAGKVYTFTVRKRAAFSDGTRLDIEVIKANYLDEFANYFGAKDAITVNGNQISFRFDEADPNHIWIFTLGIQPVEQLQAQADEKKYIGSGPYQIVNDRETDLAAVELAANKNYRGSKAKIKKVKLVNSDLASLSQMFRSGQVDIQGFGYDKGGIQAAQDNSYVSLYSMPGNRSGYIGINLRKDALKEQAVRQALAHVINYERIISRQYEGYADVNPSPFSQVSWATPAKLTAYKYDSDKALELFKMAGYQQDKSGRMSKDGQALSFTLVTYNGTHAQSVCMLIKEDLKAVGVEIEVIQLAYDKFVQRVYQAQDFDLYYGNWQYGVSEDIAARFGEPGADVNPEGWYPNEVQALIEKAKDEADWQQKKNLYQQLAVLYHEQVPQIPIDTPRSFVAVSRDIKHMKFSPYVSPVWNLEKLTNKKR